MATQDMSSLNASLRSRLSQIEGYLREDPNNTPLLVEAFEVALRCGEWATAFFYLSQGKALEADRLAWALREGDYWLAQRNYDQARTVLEHLQGTTDAPAGFAEVLAHNLAYIDFTTGAYADCVNRLAPNLEAPRAAQTPPLQESVRQALQILWLRALHRLRELSRAISWTKDAEGDGRLDPQAAGISSLIALDAGNFADAQRWAKLALSHSNPDDRPIEALVAQASLSLGARDVAQARKFADMALQINPEDGRAWSVRAFADLLNRDLDLARVHFMHAIAAMPAHIGTWHGQGWAQLLSQDLDGAQSSFEAALALDGNFAESHGGLAVVLALKRAVNPAQDHIELALRLDRENLSGRYAQAILNGEAQDSNALHRLIHRLLGSRAAPFGGQMSDWFSEDRTGKPSTDET